MKKFIFPFLMVFALTIQAQDNAVPKPQYLNWGVIAGPSATAFAMQLPASYTEPLEAKPGLGIELGAFLDYNLSRLWTMQFSALAGCGNVYLINGSAKDQLLPHSIDIAVRFGLRIPTGNMKMLVYAGPYSQFTFACPTFGTNNLENPYTRQIDENGNIALNDFHSGASMSLGIENPQGWQLMLNYNVCLTDILNIKSQEAYVLPQKLSFTLGKRF